MAKQRSVPLAQAGSLGGGWGGAVLNLLFTVFIVAIVFGVLLIAVTITNTTLAGGAPTSVTYAFQGTSANAVNDIAANILTITYAGTYTNWISTANPLIVTITGNVFSTYSTSNNVYAVPGLTISNTFTITNSVSGNVISDAGGIFYNISSMTLSGVPGSAYPTFTATVTQQFSAFPHGAAGTGGVKTTNTISVSNLATVYNASLTSIGNSSGSVSSVYGALVGYLVTLANFVGIIILLAIIVVVIGVLYVFFRPGGNTGVM